MVVVFVGNERGLEMFVGVFLYGCKLFQSVDPFCCRKKGHRNWHPGIYV